MIVRKDTLLKMKDFRFFIFGLTLKQKLLNLFWVI